MWLQASKHMLGLRQQGARVTRRLVPSISSFSTIRTTSRWSQSPAFLGQYVPRDNHEIKVVLMDPRKDTSVWDDYKENMDLAFSKYGVGVEERQLNEEAPETMLLALATCLKTDELVGGIRIEGPFATPEDMFAIRACQGLPHAEVVRDRIQEVLFDQDPHHKVMEARGNWVHRKGISQSLARAGCHLRWFTNATYLGYFSGTYAMDLYRRIGCDDGVWFDKENPQKNPSFVYPDERYETVNMFMTPNYISLLDPETRHMVRYEQRVLAHAKERHWNAQVLEKTHHQKKDGKIQEASSLEEILQNEGQGRRQPKKDPYIETMVLAHEKDLYWNQQLATKHIKEDRQFQNNPQVENSDLPCDPSDEVMALAHAKDQYFNHKEKSKMTDLQAWCPEILLSDDPRVKELQKDPSIEILNHQPSQFQELAQDRLPRVADPELLQEPSHWIYLPWRKTMLQLLGPKGYHLLRTDRNRYKMTEEETQALTLKSVGVMGMSVGHTCAVTIAQEGLCGHLKLADFDTLELSNLNRIPTSILELGKNKTFVTARRIAEIDPYLPLDVYPEGATEKNIGEFMSNIDCVIEECDSLNIKVLARFEAAKKRIPLIQEASDYGKLDVERFDLDPTRPPFHGLAGDSLVPENLKGLSTDDKAPLVLDILELEKISPRMAASFMEVDRTISSWPQLARDVTLGGALVATAVHKLFSDPDNLPSGGSRTYLDDAVINLKDPLKEKKKRVSIKKPPQFSRRPPLPDDALQAIYAGAGYAPSGGNVQPWVFSHDETHFHVAACSSGPPSGMDIDCRATAVACGAALANAAAIAAMRFGVDDPIIWNGDLDHIEKRLVAGEKVHVGSIRLRSEGGYTNKNHQQWAELGAFVNDRVTNRQKGPPIPLCDDQVKALEEVLGPYGNLYYMPVNHPDYDTVLDGWERAERVRLLDSRLHREMFEEIVWPERGDDLQEGIDVQTLELTEKNQRMMRVLERVDSMHLLSQWNLGQRLGEEARKNLKSCAGMVTVGVRGDGSFEDHVQGGIAMERMWLKATSLGLSLQPWSPIFGYAKSQETLSSVVGAHKAELLYPSARAALDAIGMQEGLDHFVLSLRIHSGPPASVISQRRQFLMQDKNASDSESEEAAAMA